MKFLCYRGKKDLAVPHYTYCARTDSLKLFAGDLAGIANMIFDYAEHTDGVTLSGDIKNCEVKQWEMSNPHGLPKRVLEELALIVKNKTSHHRDLKIE